MPQARVEKSADFCFILEALVKFVQTQVCLHISDRNAVILCLFLVQTKLVLCSIPLVMFEDTRSISNNAAYSVPYYEQHPGGVILLEGHFCYMASAQLLPNAKHRLSGSKKTRAPSLQ